MDECDDTKPQRRCVRCRGRGWIVLFIDRSECPDCDGAGIMASEDDLEFDDEETPPRGTPVPGAWKGRGGYKS